MAHNARRATDQLKEALQSAAASASPEPGAAQRPLKALEDAHRVIGEGSQRVAELVTRLRSFSRLDEAERQECTLAESIREALAILEPSWDDGVRIQLDLVELPPMHCHPRQLNQLWMNLLLNAKQAIATNGSIRVRSYAGGDAQVVEVSDDGCGIAQDLLPRVFDPGFSTKGTRIGSGFGLAICYQIAEDHGGFIDIESELGSGTTVTVRLRGLRGTPSSPSPEPPTELGPEEPAPARTPGS